MKLRHRFGLVSSVTLALTLAPAAPGGIGLGGLPGAEPSSFAQGAPTPATAPADGVTEVARQRYQEGVKAFDAGRYEEARAAFLQAYALKRTPAVLLNVALSELRTPVDHSDDAGNHFQQFLREVPTAAPEQRATAEKGIADAKRRAGVIAVSVDAAGADVSIDGTSIGKAPIADPVFVKPGKHTLFAQYQGHNAAVVVDVKPGASTAANLTTGVTGAPMPAMPTPVPGAPTTEVPPGAPGGYLPGTNGAPGGPPQGTIPQGGYPPGAPGGYPPGASSGWPGTPPGAYAPGGAYANAPGGAMPGGPEATGTREPFNHWYKRKPIAWIGSGVTGVGLVMGVVAGAVALADHGAVSNFSAQIKAEVATQNADDSANGWMKTNPSKRTDVCGDATTGAGGVAFYDNACLKVRNKIAAYNTDVGVTIAGWALFGVGLVGTGIYAMVDWYPKKVAPDAATGLRVLGVAPLVGPGQHGIGLVGSF
jgi:PEGA domain